MKNLEQFQRIVERQNREESVGIAVIPIFDEITRPVCQDVENQLLAALDTSYISLIVFEICSAGGYANGLENLTALLHGCRGEKKIVSLINCHALSAAYAIAAATSEILLGCRTAKIGSIGIRIAIPKKPPPDPANEEIIFTSGLFKEPGQAKSPDEKKLVVEEIAGWVRLAHDEFCENIALYRGLSLDTVKGFASDSKIFHAQEAISLGLADSFYDIYNWRRFKKIIKK